LAGQAFVYRIGNLAALERQPGKAPLAELRQLPASSRFALQTPVRLGPLQGTRYPLLSGLAPGELVITSGVINLRHGQPVRLD
jgi:multidrug efflux pump subunit AcrA (membrane-fusion protein)